MQFPYRDFLEPFCDLQCNRNKFLVEWLTKNSIPFHNLSLANKQHLVLKFDRTAYDPRFRQKILIAHYDRALNSPGANDNSAACLQLLLLARVLSTSSHYMAPHNVRIILTDGEEAAGIEGIRGQGSFSLGTGLVKLQQNQDDIYIFDVCGKGNTLVVSTSGITGSINFDAKLHERAQEIARLAVPEQWIRLPTPYSDNAGFLAAKIPSQVFTVLPAEEAAILMRELNYTPIGRDRALLIQKIHENTIFSRNDETIPYTWKRLHTSEDSIDSLTLEAFQLIGKVLDKITTRMYPAY